MAVSSTTIWGVLPLLLSLIGAQPGSAGQSVTRLMVQDEVILRVTIQPRPLLPDIEWVERKGPRCIPLSGMRAALLSGPDRMDFIYANRARVRAKFDENCPALDYYGRFYLQPDGDQLCAGRDVIHSRMGGSCTIERFKQLVPKFHH
jgi:hypothetical protein